MQLVCQMMTVVKAGEHPCGKETERGKRDRAARGEVQFEPMDVSEVETKGSTDDSPDRHGMAHDSYRAAQRTLAKTVDHRPSSLLEGS